MLSFADASYSGYLYRPPLKNVAPRARRPVLLLRLDGVARRSGSILYAYIFLTTGGRGPLTLFTGPYRGFGPINLPRANDHRAMFSFAPVRLLRISSNIARWGAGFVTHLPAGGGGPLKFSSFLTVGGIVGSGDWHRFGYFSDLSADIIISRAQMYAGSLRPSHHTPPSMMESYRHWLFLIFVLSYLCLPYKRHSPRVSLDVQTNCNIPRRCYGAISEFPAGLPIGMFFRVRLSYPFRRSGF